MFRSEVPSSIEWRCTSCGDDGVISGWEDSPFHLSAVAGREPGGVDVRIVVTAEVARTLQTVMLLDGDLERVVFGASVMDEMVVFSADADMFDELLGCVAADGNHEPDRRRRLRLDEAFDVLQDALATV